MNRMIKCFSWVIVVLFCWVIFPIKWVKKILFNERKERAIAYADAMAKKNNRVYYVVQVESDFYVGTRDFFRERDGKMKRELKKKGLAFLDWDYRNAIIYKAKR